MTSAEFLQIARQFALDEPMAAEPFARRGNINLDTALIQAGPNGDAYLLQRINTDVFPLADRVMAGMCQSLEAQRRARAAFTHLEWQVPELVPTREGDLYLKGEGVWRMMRYIEGTVSYKSLSELPVERRLDTAYQVGRGLALYHDHTSDINASNLTTSLPGYRDTRLYFDQLDAALEGARSYAETIDRLPTDPETRQATARHFLCVLSEDKRITRREEVEHEIGLAYDHRAFAIDMQRAREDGEIRETAIHGDTKLENFLFDAQSGEVRALVDLDTIMPHTWLADWGDMVRSLVNVAGEKERKLDKVRVDRDVYMAVAAGFLDATETVTEAEIAWMSRAVQVITLELGIRFLADYLRGDTYFSLGPNDPRDLNKVRAQVQLRLFEELLTFDADAAIRAHVKVPSRH
jgi:N-acetylhexosamine 1-kinase